MTKTGETTIPPWYKQFWPWYIISIPLVTVIAGIAMTITAFTNRDALVVDNYYKEGLGINRVIQAQENAARLGLQAQAMFSVDTGRLRLVFPGNLNIDNQIKLSLIHATIEKFDRDFVLDKGEGNIFTLNIKNIESGRWNMILQSSDNRWRLDANILLPAVNWKFKPDV